MGNEKKADQSTTKSRTVRKTAAADNKTWKQYSVCLKEKCNDPLSRKTQIPKNNIWGHFQK